VLLKRARKRPDAPLPHTITGLRDRAILSAEVADFAESGGAGQPLASVDTIDYRSRGIWCNANRFLTWQ
jgi:hypothetical protein